MSQWDKLFQQKLKEVMHHKHRDYEYASLSPTASGNVARALIAEEYSAQADRIAELQKQLDTRTKELIGASFYEHDYKTMMANSEPVAWMYYDDWNKLKLGQTMPPDPDWFPVYTHPVKEKGLPRSSPSPMNQACLTRSDNYISDEVIEQLAKQFGVVGLHEDAGLYEFARAILRKAQEK